MQSAFIDDGYTEDVRLPEIPGIAPAIRLTFRPMTTSEYANYLQFHERNTPVETKSEASRLLQSKICTWDLKNGRGESVPCTADNIQRLKPVVWNGLWEIVAGTRAGEKVTAEKVDTDQKN